MAMLNIHPILNCHQILVLNISTQLCVFAEYPSRSGTLCWWPPATVTSSRAPELWSTLWWYLAMWPLSADNTRYGQLRNSTFAISLSVSTHWALKDRWPVILPSPRTSTSCIPDPAPGTRLPGCPGCYLTLQISSAQNIFNWRNITHIYMDEMISCNVCEYFIHFDWMKHMLCYDMYNSN